MTYFDKRPDSEKTEEMNRMNEYAELDQKYQKLKEEYETILFLHYGSDEYQKMKELTQKSQSRKRAGLL